MHTGRRPCDNEGRDWGDAPISQETPETARKPPEARGEAWNRATLTGLKRNQSCLHLDHGHLASRTIRKHISVV